MLPIIVRGAAAGLSVAGKRFLPAVIKRGGVTLFKGGQLAARRMGGARSGRILMGSRAGAALKTISINSAKTGLKGKVLSLFKNKWFGRALDIAGWAWLLGSLVGGGDDGDGANNGDGKGDLTKDDANQILSEGAQESAMEGFYSNPTDTSDKIDERIPDLLNNYVTPLGSAKERSVMYDQEDDHMIAKLSFRNRQRLFNHYLSRIIHLIANTEEADQANLFKTQMVDAMVLGERPGIPTRIAAAFVDSPKGSDKGRYIAASQAILDDLAERRLSHKQAAIQTVFGDNTSLNWLTLGLGEETLPLHSGEDVTVPMSELIAAAFPSGAGTTFAEIGQYLSTLQWWRVDDDLQDDEASVIYYIMKAIDFDKKMQSDYNNEILYNNYDNRLNYD